jgi:hypothetical protein
MQQPAAAPIIMIGPSVGLDHACDTRHLLYCVDGATCQVAGQYRVLVTLPVQIDHMLQQVAGPSKCQSRRAQPPGEYKTYICAVNI